MRRRKGKMTMRVYDFTNSAEMNWEAEQRLYVILRALKGREISRAELRDKVGVAKLAATRRRLNRQLRQQGSRERVRVDKRCGFVFYRLEGLVAQKGH